MLQIARSRPVFDVVVIGSGAGGGTAVKVLTDRGLDVALLEAGPMLNPSTDFKEHLMPYQVDHRGAGPHAELYFGQQAQALGYFAAPNGNWSIPGEPYTVARGSRFQWFRSRILGGRTNHWGRISLRFSDYDFQPEDGLTDPWPVTYAEMSPWYDKAEGFMGVTGTREGLRTAPDGNFLPPIAPRVHEILFQAACRKLNIPCIPSRMAVLTKPLNGRAACHYCGQCDRGCRTASAFTSSQAMIFPAMASGRLTVFTGAMARELVADSSGSVTAVSYVEKASRTEKQIRCRAVVVAASACETARLLLNSKSSQFPNGIANSSGEVGRRLTDTVGYGLSAFVPALANLPRHNSDGIKGMHVYVPWWLYGDRQKDFPRGYHIEIGGGFQLPELGSFTEQCADYQGYGKALKDRIREEYGAFISLGGRGEMISNANSYCEIDPQAVDSWGIPVLRFHFAWSDHEFRQVRHMEQTFASIVETMGGKIATPQPPPPSAISVGGMIIHESGTARMGRDPKTSVLNEYCQAHDVKNLFIADAAPFVTQPDKNVTLSIVAFAWRASEYLAEEMRKGNV